MSPKTGLLVAAVTFMSAPSFALQSINDDEMASVSGQAGITIDTTVTQPTRIGEIRYENAPETGPDSTGETGSISLTDIVIEDSSFSLEFDVLPTEAVLKLTRFAPTDINIGGLHFGYDSSVAPVDPDVKSTRAQLRNAYTNIGSIEIDNYTLAPTADITFKFNSDGDLLFTAGMPTGSFFHLTYIDDGEFIFDANGDGDATLTDTGGRNYISTRVEFNDFRVEDISIKPVEEDGITKLKLSLSNTSGGIEFRDVNINGRVIGNVGYENINVDPVSYIKILGQ